MRPTVAGMTEDLTQATDTDLLMRVIKSEDPAALAECRRRDELLSDSPPRFCCTCGAAVWPLLGTDVLTCRRGHHQPNLWMGQKT
jgi:hypothetical protein